jgi:hypothetical protein
MRRSLDAGPVPASPESRSAAMKPSPIAAWHEAVATKAFDGIEALIAEDAVFFSPVLHSPQVGKALVAKYLRSAMSVLNNETFRYVGEWTGEDSAVLEFELVLDGIYVDGVDLIRWNEQGLIVQFKVMMRPLKALNTVIPLMAAQLSGAAGG